MKPLSRVNTCLKIQSLILILQIVINALNFKNWYFSRTAHSVKKLCETLQNWDPKQYLCLGLLLTVHYFQGQLRAASIAEQQVVFVHWSCSLWLHNPSTIQSLNLQTMNILIFTYFLLLHGRVSRQNELSFACDHFSSTAGCCVLFLFLPSTAVLSIH